MLSLATIQTFLGVTGDDDYLLALERAAVADVENLTGRYLGLPAAFTDYFRVRRPACPLARAEIPMEPRAMWLENPPIDTAAVVISEREDYSSAWAVVDRMTTDTPPREVFEFEGRRMYRLIGEFPAGRRAVKVDYTAGYAEDAAPAPFQAVVLDLIRYRYIPESTRNVAGAVQSVSIRGVSVNFGASGSGADTGGSAGISAGLKDRILGLRDAGLQA